MNRSLLTWHRRRYFIRFQLVGSFFIETILGLMWYISSERFDSNMFMHWKNDVSVISFMFLYPQVFIIPTVFLISSQCWLYNLWVKEYDWMELFILNLLIWKGVCCTQIAFAPNANNFNTSNPERIFPAAIIFISLFKPYFSKVFES